MKVKKVKSVKKCWPGRGGGGASKCPQEHHVYRAIVPVRWVERRGGRGRILIVGWGPRPTARRGMKTSMISVPLQWVYSACAYVPKLCSGQCRSFRTTRTYWIRRTGCLSFAQSWKKKSMVFDASCLEVMRTWANVENKGVIFESHSVPADFVAARSFWTWAGDKIEKVVYCLRRRHRSTCFWAESKLQAGH